jgi:hypothetical protein
LIVNGDRDPNVVMLLEVGGSIFGILGLGWIYAGRPVLGVALLVGYLILDWVVGLSLSVVTLGLWCLVWPAQNLLFGALSGYLARRWIEENGD